MSLAQRIAASNRRPSATVFIGGRRWANVLSLSTTRAYGQGIAAGQIEGVNPPLDVVEGETPVSWTWGYDGFQIAAFTGIVTRIVQRAYPNRIILTVSDPLWLADIRRGDIATTPLNDVPASEAIRQILSGAGISRFALTPLAASGSAWAGSEWVLGTLTPVAFKNTTRLAAAQRIAEALGYWLYADAGGTVRTILLERRPSDSPFRTLTWGQDFALASPPERARDAAQIKNRVVVTGAETGVLGTRITDMRQTGAGDREFTYANELIEYVNASQAGEASAENVATRLLTLWSRPPNVINIGSLNADPRISVGMTVAVACDRIGLATARPFFVYSVSTSLDLRSGSFTQQLTLDGGTGSGGFTLIPPPLAAMAWKLVRESLDGESVVELFLDGSASMSLSEGEIMSWDWVSGTPTYGGTPTTASGEEAAFIYPATTLTATITLTVTDTSSKTDTITQEIALTGDDLVQPTAATISLALGSAWAVSPDGGENWNVEATGDATLVPERGGLIATRGTGSTGLRATEDALASASTDLATLGAAITALSRTPNTDRVWAATGTTLRRSADNGQTFAVWGTLPAAITAVLEDPVVESSVFVLAANVLYHATTPTPGTGWTPLFTGPAGAIARHFVRGEGGATTWIAFTGSFTGSPLRRVEGPLSASFPALTPAVTEIRAIALATDEQTVYAWDSEGRGFAVASDTGIATAIDANLAAGETAQHALHAPDVPIVYLATFGASAGTTYKYIPLLDRLFPFYVPASGQQSHRIGYGDPVRISGTEVLLLTAGASPGGVWAWQEGTGWTLRNGGLPSGWTWVEIQVNPQQPDTWLLRGYNGTSVTFGASNVTSGGQSILWLTTDAGATWAAVPVESPGSVYADAGRFTTVRRWSGFTTDNRIFMLGAADQGDAFNTGAVWLWTGTAAGITPTTIRAQRNPDARSAVAGQGGDIAVSWAASNSSSVQGRGFVDAAGTYTVVSNALGFLLPVATTGRAMTYTYNNGIRVPDYRLAGQNDAPTNVAGAMANGDMHYVTGGTNANTISRASNYMDTPTYDGVVYTPSPAQSITAITSDAQTRTAVAAVGVVPSASNATVIYSEDGTTWQAFAGPASTTALSATLAIIVRGDS